VGGVKYLANIDRRLRSANRGVECVFREGSELPYFTPTADQGASQELYWRRLTEMGRFMARAGTRLGSVTSYDSPMAILTVGRIETRPLVVPPEIRHNGPDTLPQSYAPMCHDISRVRHLGDALMQQGASWPDPMFWAVTLLLRIMVDLVEYRPHWLSMLQFGFSSIDYDWFLELVDERIAIAAAEMLPTPSVLSGVPLTGAGLCGALNKLRASIRPFRAGSPIRVDGNIALIDVAGAAAVLDHCLDFTVETGAVANVRARHFEMELQNVIDSSSWAPSARLRELRGRTLRLGGRPITDVDALAARGSTLLLVSGKSQVFAPDHDAGEFRAVRNASDRVVEACEDAVELQHTLALSPRGDNYDLTDFNQHAVVVCTPFVVYVPIGIATQEVLTGLSAAVSLAELEEFFAKSTG
jgi:hypothetical protein